VERRFLVKGLIEEVIPSINVISELKSASLIAPCSKVKKMDIQRMRNSNFLLCLFFYSSQQFFPRPARVIP
jgi:hypothetical protein